MALDWEMSMLELLLNPAPVGSSSRRRPAGVTTFFHLQNKVWRKLNPCHSPECHHKEQLLEDIDTL